MPEEVVYTADRHLVGMNETTNAEITDQNDQTELTSREEQVDPVLDLVNGDVVAGRDDTGLVQAAVELNNDLARTVVVDNLELADVACVKRHVSTKVQLAVACVSAMTRVEIVRSTVNPNP